MIVYGSSLSPYVRKVLVVAAERGIAVQNVPTPPGSDDPEFREASPFGKIPGFRDGPFTVSDSSAIIAYLDTVGDIAPLIPAEPKARARAIWYDEFADTMLGETGKTIFRNRVVDPRLRKIPGDLAAADRAESEELPRAIDYLEKVVPGSGYLVEDRLTLADIAVASPLATLAHAGIRVNAATHPKAAAYFAAILARPAFAELIAQEEAFLARFAD